MRLSTHLIWAVAALIGLSIVANVTTADDDDDNDDGEGQEEILSHMSIVFLDDGMGNMIKTIRITGVNVQVVNGMDDTATTNGAGNLIIGYNEDPPEGVENRSGSHNLVVGIDHTFNSYGGFVVGRSNRITGTYASVSGGNFNEASGNSSSVSGGSANVAFASSSTVSGGSSNRANSPNSSVSGGQLNTATGSFSSISGGRQCTVNAGGLFASVSGGLNRSVSGAFNWRAGSLFQSQ